VTWAEALEAASAHCESCYPAEGCGALIAGGGRFRAQPMLNARGSAARGCFALESRELLALLQNLDRTGDELVAVFHSHPDRAAYLSDADRRGALIAGTLALPGADLIVISVLAGRAGETTRFRWANQDWERQNAM
jgi:proteasome lid subunit RPN8/RPN11